MNVFVDLSRSKRLYFFWLRKHEQHIKRNGWKHLEHIIDIRWCFVLSAFRFQGEWRMEMLFIYFSFTHIHLTYYWLIFRMCFWRPSQVRSNDEVMFAISSLYHAQVHLSQSIYRYSHHSHFTCTSCLLNWYVYSRILHNINTKVIFYYDGEAVDEKRKVQSLYRLQRQSFDIVLCTKWGVVWIIRTMYAVIFLLFWSRLISTMKDNHFRTATITRIEYARSECFEKCTFSNRKKKYDVYTCIWIIRTSSICICVA